MQEEERDIEAVTLYSWIRALEGACYTDDVAANMPYSESNGQWDVAVRSTGAVLNKTRCIVGRSLKADCRLHSVYGSPCKYAQFMLWSIAGKSMTAEEHNDVAASLPRSWRWSRS